jgi:fatty acid desaturase
MRLWLKDSERRLDPEPVKTDDRKAILVGLVLWLIALGGLLVMLPMLIDTDNVWWLWTCVVGLGFGLVGLLYTHRRHV